MSLNTADKIFLTVGLLNFGGIFIYLGLVLYMAYSKMDFLLSQFQSSPAATALAPLRNGGPWGKILVIGSIASFLTFPEYYIKRGSISANDINNFPSQLKCRLVALHKIGLVLLFVMLTIGLLAELDLT